MIGMDKEAILERDTVRKEMKERKIIRIFYCNTGERYSTKGDEGKEDNKDILLQY
jgi:hypothetical protein